MATPPFREVILKSALVKRLAELKDWKEGKKPLYRNKLEREEAKAIKHKQAGRVLDHHQGLQQHH